MNVKQSCEEREETCSVVSKLVKIKIFRNDEGEIIDFDCGSSGSTCLSKCHYRMLMADY